MQRGMIVGAVALVVAGLGADAATAAPQRLARTPGAVVDGPRLAGESVFYGELGSRRRVLRLAGPNFHRVKLASIALPPEPLSEEEESPGDFQSFASLIEASSERLAYKEAFTSGNARYQQGQSRVTLYGGGPGGPFGQPESCTSDGIWGPVSAAVDVDGPRVAASDCSGRIVIRDHTGPTPTSTTVSPGEMMQAGSIALAGRYVAYNAFPYGPTGTTPTVTVVHDWVSNAKVYEIPRVTSFDLQDDGTLAVSTGAQDDAGCDGGKLAWYSPAQPTEHVLPVEPCSPDVRIAGGRIATVAAGARSADRVVALVGLDGARTDVANLGAESMLRGSIDYDGARVAYALANCAGGADLRTESAAAPEPRSEAPACPAAIAATRTVLRPRARGVLVAVACSRGCAGTATIRMRVEGRRHDVATRSLRISPDDVCRDNGVDFEVKLPSAAREEIKRRRTVAGQLILRTVDRDGARRTTKRPLTLTTRPPKAPPGGTDCAATQEV